MQLKGILFVLKGIPKTVKTDALITRTRAQDSRWYLGERSVGNDRMDRTQLGALFGAYVAISAIAQ